ncbi:hypothetical protein [Pseudomonas alloputida]|uniref:hypothetical protein n=1 Tax=Pseudomonas TaxID=286 RepID=UPI003EE9C2F3
MKDLIKDEAQVRLWLVKDEYIYPVGINHQGFVQVIDGHNEIFTLLAWKHPSIGGDIAYEIHSQSGKQITGAGGDALREAEELMPMPVPAFRIMRENTELEEPWSYEVKLKTLDSRFVSANDRIASTHRRKREGFSWWALSPWEDVTRYRTEPGRQLRMLEPYEADADVFILEWLDPPGGRQQ